MRIWSLHPAYLDTKGLVALWRETLLAKYVLEGKTKGYRQHPQLDRFKRTADPVKSVDQYLSHVYFEAEKRGYKFDKSKINQDFKPIKITVTNGQINFEASHLRKKLKIRDHKKYQEFLKTGKPIPHPIFRIVNGAIETWEKL
jgi:hypothetical protein